MSGNPFRRSQPALQPASTAGLDGSHELADDWPPADQKVPVRTKKHVRLASPPASPPEPSSPEVDDNLARRLSAARHAGSPPPLADLSDASSDDTADEPSEDSPINQDDQDDDAPLKPAASGYPAKMDTLSRTSGVPNPFERTLANIEPAEQQNAFDSEKTSSGVQTAADRSAGHKAKGSMDVDSFKRLLMTGNAAPPPSSTSPTADIQPRAHITIGGDTSSGTEASSASRNSLFESVLQVHEDSPRSSYERTSFDGGNDDDQSTLIGGERKLGKKKPPPPKHRHGKSITRAPQVVSFSDFSPSFESPGARPEGPKRTASDVHKPLPPRPRGSSGPKQKDLPSPPPAEPVPPKDPSDFHSADEPADNLPPTKTPEQAPAAPQRRKPPTPPISRRHSQLKSSDSRSRSNSAATLSSQPEGSFPSAEQTPTTSPPPPPSLNKPPPPPPTRRSGAASSTADVSASAISRSSSRRSTASSMQNPRRSSHRLSGSALDMTSPSATVAVGGPPPPPPRRGSSKSSFEMQRPSASVLAAAGVGGDNRRESGEFKRRSRTASGASERVLTEYAEADESAVVSPNGMEGGAEGGVDLLSELDKLQQEVEALRQKSVTKA
ncbi:hypothetical protein GTA08_BOTSDO06874 [Botryosphaeria dothidea]|uniref:Uncharacterized protein n=1 Tax=Botryosphaeria dothidea TaxID=55169 RepID=A0A8H4N2M8_9PEZI|nr:hypothetical protein GTA08_BOTSDO11069 [Botryosphaeria dothidea]KAF4304873.1 hypothetical protein GTA08_BOTSDO06874 [Botryosphaeria dothidea]